MFQFVTTYRKLTSTKGDGILRACPRKPVDVPMNRSFDIFSGSGEHDCLWLECVEGLDAATERMHEIASKRPGMYLVLSIRDRSVTAKTDTTSLASGTGQIYRKWPTNPSSNP